MSGEEPLIPRGSQGDCVAAEVPEGDSCSAIVSIPSCGIVDCGPTMASAGGAMDEAVDENCSAKLDALGPIILNTDGTMGRISNWSQFTETERAQALRLVAARNKKRKEALLLERASGTSTTEVK